MISNALLNNPIIPCYNPERFNYNNHPPKRELLDLGNVTEYMQNMGRYDHDIVSG
jgi:hypothetical protein